MKIEKEDRLSEIVLSWADCLMEARFQYLQAGNLDRVRNITDRLSSVFVRNGFYDAVRLLNSELLQFEEHPSPMSWIARSYADQADYTSAASWYLPLSFSILPYIYRASISVPFLSPSTIRLYRFSARP